MSYFKVLSAAFSDLSAEFGYPMRDYRRLILVIGAGMLALAFTHFLESDSVLIFASGVSNSLEVSAAAFERERNLLLQTCDSHPNKNIIYFSSCSVYDPLLKETPYVIHKLAMENLLKQKGVKYTIYRLSQVVGRSKSTTIFNFIKTKIIAGEEFELWKNSYRDFIDVDDIVKIVTYSLSNELFCGATVNIASGKPQPILEIVREFEKVLGVAAKFKSVPKGAYYRVNIQDIQHVAEAVGVTFNEDYYRSVIAKYSL